MTCVRPCRLRSRATADLVRPLKENLLWVRSFAAVAELVEALRQFQLLYNEQWLIERHGYRSPSQVRREREAVTRAVA